MIRQAAPRQCQKISELFFVIALGLHYLCPYFNNYIALLMNFIETKDVVKQYDGHLALDRVSINVPQGCVFGLLGPNGAGKTSLIRILNMITRADSGEVLFDGHPLHEKDIANIGYLPEERGLYRKMKVADHIMYIARLRGMRSNDARDAMRKWLERFDLTQWAGKKIEALSKGMAQKVQFISTVIHSPKLLIFDEPFSGFDPVNTELLKKEILHLHDEGATIIFSTHNMASVEEVCEEFALINRSRVVLDGKVSEVRRRFSKKLYKVDIADTMKFDPVDGLFSIEHTQPSPFGGITADIRLAATVTMHDAVAYINDRYALTAFHELLPSMNEIFIETVSSNNHQSASHND